MPQVFSALFTLKRFTNFSIIITTFQIPFDIIVLLLTHTVKKKKKLTFTVKYRQLWLPELNRKKYGSNI